MNKRKLQKKQTREKILDAAYSVIETKGFSKTKTLEIAKKAEVSHGLLFAHFKTKDAILTEIVNRFGDMMLSRIHDSVARNFSLDVVLSAHLKSLEEHEDIYYWLIKESNLIPEASRNIIISIQSALSFHFSKALESGVNNKSLKKIPIHLLFNTWLGLIHYYILNRNLFCLEGSVIKKYHDELLNHFLILISKGN